MIFCLHNVFICLICFVHFDNDKTLVIIFKTLFIAWLLLFFYFLQKFYFIVKAKIQVFFSFFISYSNTFWFCDSKFFFFLLQGSLSSIKVSSSWCFTCGSFVWLSCLKLLLKINMNLIHIICSGRTIMIYFHDAKIDAPFEFSY